MVVPTQPVTPINPIVKSDESDLIIIPSSKKLKPIIHNSDLPYSPQIEYEKPALSCTRDEYIENHDITGSMKDLIVACDYDNPTVRNNTANLVHSSSGNFNLGQVCDIFDFCYINWSYVNDPITKDYYSKASETLRNGLNGDCDDFAILLCSMILSIGGEARINFAYDTTSGHAFTEVNIGKTNESKVQRYLKARYNDAQMWHRKDSEGNLWLNLDWQAEYPGGKYWKYNHGTCFNIIRNIYENL
jgi:transglutaminase-like putative cysteine protease